MYGAEYGNSRAFGSSWREQYYNCAIVVADFLRRQRGTLFVIGLGEASADFSEPYQSIDDSLSRKDIFLSRVANDYTFAYRVPAHFGETVHPEFGFSGYETYDQLQQSAAPQEGVYTPTNDARQLEDIFRSMATKILLGLVR